MRRGLQSAVTVGVICLVVTGTANAIPSPASAPTPSTAPTPSSTPSTAPTPSPTPSVAPTAASAFAPLVLQGCSRHVKGNGSLVFPYRAYFDLSFQNISAKTAIAVMVHIGGSDFVKTGEFAPKAVIAWRIDAASFGTFEAQNCSIKAVRFTDGSEWNVPPTG